MDVPLDIAHTMGNLSMRLKIPKMSLNFRKWQYYGIWSKICHFRANSEIQKMALEARFFDLNGLRGCNNVTWGCTDRKTLGIESPAPKMSFWVSCWICSDSPKKIALSLWWRYQNILACKSSTLSREDLHARIFWYLLRKVSPIFFGVPRNFFTISDFMHNMELSIHDEWFSWNIKVPK